MTTLAPPELTKLANEWAALADYPSSVCSGIVGDLAHKERGGYHISIMDQPSTNYSVIKVDDKAPPGTWRRDFAAGVDMNLNLADMKKCHARIKTVWLNRKTDPRAKYFNAWNGWDGNGHPGRYNFVTGTIEQASDDHKWHIHLEAKRRYANDPAMRKAWISIVKGETVSQYLGKPGSGTGSNSNAGEDDFMSFITNQAQFNAAMDTWAKTPNGIAVLRDTPWQHQIPDYNLPDTPAKPRRKLSAETWLGYSDVQGHMSSAVLLPIITKNAADDAARDAQEAARDAALTETLKQVLAATGNATGTKVFTDEQFEALKQSINEKVAEAGADASERATQQLNQIAAALDNAGAALSTADDQTK